MALKEAVTLTPDVSIETLFNSFTWKENLETVLESFLTDYQDTLERLQEEQKTYSDVAFGLSDDKEERKKALRAFQEIDAQIRDVETLIELPNYVKVTAREQQLLRGDVLTVTGSAGVGKSQLLAYETKQLLDNQRDGLLLIAGYYLLF